MKSIQNELIIVERLEGSRIGAGWFSAIKI